MRKIGLLITLLFVVCKGFAQQDCVVLIDADKYQPFYARIGDRTYPSSAAGHLTISHLKDSTYQVHIGFPQGGIPENRFLIRVNKKDQGFQLRYLNEKGWALYNWQTSELKMPMDRDTKQASMLLDNGVKRDDAFSRLMAGVVNDTAVLYNTYVEEATPRDSSKNLVLQAVAVPAAKQEKNQKTAESMQQEKTQKTAEPAKMLTVLKIK